MPCIQFKLLKHCFCSVFKITTKLFFLDMFNVFDTNGMKKTVLGHLNSKGKVTLFGFIP